LHWKNELTLRMSGRRGQNCVHGLADTSLATF